MTDAPNRIWAWQWLLPYPSAQNGKTTWSSVAYPEEQDVAQYILATPEALAASPEVAKLVANAEARVSKAHEKEIAVWSENYAALERRLADAEARGMEHIAAIERLAIHASVASCTCLTKTPGITFHSADCRYVTLQYIIAQCEDFRDAAAIRPAAEETGT